jgi:hypothetical protein
MNGRESWARIAVLACSAFAASVPMSAADEAETTTAAPTIEAFAFMAGHWRGEGFGGTCEEIWSQPLAGTMVGSFRLVKDGEVQFYELMVLGPDAEGWALKVKHFSKEFVGWEDKEGAVRFAYESVAGSQADFKGLKILRDGDALAVSVRMRSKTDEIRWEKINLRRVDPSP